MSIRRGLWDSFNPRLRVGGDAKTPDWWAFRPGFNPRLRVGGDPNSRNGWERAYSFNPRLRVGGDHLPAHLYTSFRCFNPRLRVGGDRPMALMSERAPVSIHASAWEAKRGAKFGGWP